MISVRYLTCFALMVDGLGLMAQTPAFYFGADLSYVNEMEDCGAYYTVEGDTSDVFEVMQTHGCNLVRLRLWHTPSWYDALNAGRRYSDFDDVKLSIARAQAKGMSVMLDFHLSDTWADPGHQVVPAAWASVVDDLPVLQDSLYQYVYTTLFRLADESLLPEMVQIGNETNRGILLSQSVNDAGWSINWQRNSALFNTAIRAVRDIESLLQTPVKIALHIANPSEAVWYYEQFHAHGVTDFDIIGLSYYWPWHMHTIAAVGQYVAAFRMAYPDKEVMLLETATPWTLAFADNAGNNLNSVPPGYGPASPVNQKKWLTDLTQVVIDQGGSGVVYWEPAWVSTNCSTQWAQGSHWENCAFFDFDNALLVDGGIQWMTYPYMFSSRVDPVTSDRSCYSISGQRDGIMIQGYRNGSGNLEGAMVVHAFSLDGRRQWVRHLFLDVSEGRALMPWEGMVAGLYVIRVFDKRGCVDSGLVLRPF